MVIHDHNHPPKDDPDVVHAEIQDSETVIQTILRAVAISQNTPVIELPPLYRSVDSEALLTLIDHGQKQNSTVEISFSFVGTRVIATQDGSVYVSGE